MSGVKVHAEVAGGPDQTPVFLRLSRWESLSKRERVSVQIRREGGVMEAEVDVDLLDLLRAVDALMARPR